MKKNEIKKICENLSAFAIDRADLKSILSLIEKKQAVNLVTVEYELALLRIISVGWSLSVNLENHPEKDEFALCFWNLIRDLSKDITDISFMTAGKSIDYFNIVKQRFDQYLNSLDKSIKKSDPASAIGPAFAEICKEKKNPFVIISGAKIFNLAVSSVKEYLESVISI